MLDSRIDYPLNASNGNGRGPQHPNGDVDDDDDEGTCEG